MSNNCHEFDLFQKLFDRIKHDALLQRLHAIGFSEYSLNWFRS